MYICQHNLISLMFLIIHKLCLQLQQSNPRPRRTSSTSSKSASGNTHTQAPTTKPPTPPMGVRGGVIQSGTATLPRQGQSPYRSTAPPPVSPPSVPSHYAPGYGPSHAAANQQQTLERRPGYSALGNVQVAQVVITVMVLLSDLYHMRPFCSKGGLTCFKLKMTS